MSAQQEIDKMAGPGKYNAALVAALASVQGKTGILIIFDGDKGRGFECRLEGAMMTMVPAILRDVANQIDERVEAVTRAAMKRQVSGN